MKYKALLKTRSRDSGSVAEALEIDNVRLQDLKIKTHPGRGYIVTNVESNNLGSLLNTLDDVLYCQMLAEKVIE